MLRLCGAVDVRAEPILDSAQPFCLPLNKRFAQLVKAITSERFSGIASTTTRTIVRWSAKCGA